MKGLDMNCYWNNLESGFICWKYTYYCHICTFIYLCVREWTCLPLLGTKQQKHWESQVSIDSFDENKLPTPQHIRTLGYTPNTMYSVSSHPPPLRAKPTVHAIDSVKTIDAIVVTWYPSQKIMNNWFYSVKNYFYNKITKFLSLGTQPNIAESVQMVYGISGSAWLSPQNAIVSRPNFGLYKY